MCRKHGPKALSRRPQADHSIQGARCQHVDSAGLGDDPSQPPQPPSSPSLSLDQTNIPRPSGPTHAPSPARSTPQMARQNTIWVDSIGLSSP